MPTRITAPAPRLQQARSSAARARETAANANSLTELRAEVVRLAEAVELLIQERGR